ncbi:STAS domain-containing protein [Leptospira sp. GIMC2001]|uniref:STAS domain-containing protein n=1 Tax=Leptospira sp. GIMC2001 TaxID=1513297 RepID=UPI00234A7553|nr:STAS domain-containing protein [Leptospira sp. GIMC2001]WCL49805.1 STAS domain-containing protein [Leptospira sp. GIMC2001]
MSRLEFNSFALELNTIEVQSQQVMVVSFEGQISNNNAFEISRKINAIFETENYNLILNLTKLEYINSVGVAMLLTIIKTVDQHNGKVVIGGLNHFLENVIKLMELPKKVLIFHSIDEARVAWE